VLSYIGVGNHRRPVPDLHVLRSVGALASPTTGKGRTSDQDRDAGSSGRRRSGDLGKSTRVKVPASIRLNPALIRDAFGTRSLGTQYSALLAVPGGQT
jgi:hypothetical protein